MTARIVLGLALLVLIIAFLKIYYPTIRNPKSPIPQLLPMPTKIQDSKVFSPDGTMKLIIRAKTQENGLALYSFSVSGENGKDEKALFLKEIKKEGSMALPHNAWSPDNKYVFLKESNPSSFSMLVFKADGTTFANGKPYLDPVLLFKERQSGRITDITGWDAPTLMHVQTALDNGKKGPIFWFDVEASSFLQLATR